jgi:cyclic beta-1,2-glucan synthetase
MGYPKGLRENGGQYTHGSTWMAMAWARLGEGQKAVRLLQMMNPIESNRGPADVARYRGEPYVMAGDVWNAAGHIGQSGWTWYTGSAAWMYRIWIEEVLGFRLRGDRFTVEPVLPADWPGFELTYRHGSTVYEIKVIRHGDESIGLELDGKPVIFIPVEDTGRTHRVMVRVPQSSTAGVAAAPEVLLLTPVAAGESLQAL